MTKLWSKLETTSNKLFKFSVFFNNLFLLISNLNTIWPVVDIFSISFGLFIFFCLECYSLLWNFKNQVWNFKNAGIGSIGVFSQAPTTNHHSQYPKSWVIGYPLIFVNYKPPNMPSNTSTTIHTQQIQHRGHSKTTSPFRRGVKKNWRQDLIFFCNIFFFSEFFFFVFFLRKNAIKFFRILFYPLFFFKNFSKKFHRHSKNKNFEKIIANVLENSYALLGGGLWVSKKSKIVRRSFWMAPSPQKFCHILVENIFSTKINIFGWKYFFN
jgi:hypothetical protein